MNLGGTVHVNKKGFFVLLFCTIILFIYLYSHNGTEKVINRINLRKLLAVAVQAAENGGREVVEIRNNLKIESKGKTKEGANDSVTTADYKSHCVMLHNLKANFPTVQVISEESIECGDDYSSTGTMEFDGLIDEWVHEDNIRVWIDPLDATQEYTEKLYEYVTTMVCVAINGAPVIGVIHKPFLRTTSWAWVGKSNSFDAIKPREDNVLKFIVSRSHTGKVKEAINEAFKEKEVEIISAGGAGYKVLEVVNGKADAYLHVTAIKKWDICAGNAILNALGGRMTTKQNTVINYSDSDDVVNENGLIATLKNHQYYVDKLK
ncbi:hypothetical protein RN001_014700 [Aquatica leii]|uniref:Putative inositol monophosphatase 3 n=1 Tax=Aquatica leii TaxID=1421715 RepID=A0AAN7S6B3_9COLE|nr:hypothetical protein RN001_014700 [Aquatica leii]